MTIDPLNINNQHQERFQTIFPLIVKAPKSPEYEIKCLKFCLFIGPGRGLTGVWPSNDNVKRCHSLTIL